MKTIYCTTLNTINLTLSNALESTTIKVDHIKEKTTSHKIVVDNDLIPYDDYVLNLGNADFPFANV